MVLTRNAPTTVYTDRDEKQVGPEFDLVEAFASSLDLKVEYRIKSSIREIITAIENGEGDLAAAGLTITDKRRQKFIFGPAYQDVTQQVVCRRDNVQPDSIEDLIGLNITVIADSSYVERLQVLREQHAGLEWTETSTEDTEQLLRSVWLRKIDCTIADSNIVDINRRYFPELIAPINLNDSESLGWMMSSERGDLQEAIEEWFEPFSLSGELSTLQERYYGFRRSVRLCRHAQIHRAHQDALSPLPGLLRRSRGEVRIATPAVGGAGLPGIALARQCAQSHGRTRHHDADPGHCAGPWASRAGWIRSKVFSAAPST